MKRILYFRPIFYGFVFALLGITLSRRLIFGDVDAILITLLVFTIITLLSYHFKKFQNLLVLALAFMLGVSMFFVGYITFMGREFSGFVSVTGKVEDSIREKEGYFSIILTNVNVNGEGVGNVEVYVYKSEVGEGFKAGDFLAFEGIIEHVKLFTLGDMNTGAFRNNAPYKTYVYSNKITVTEGGLTFSESLRAIIKENLDKNMSEDNAALAYASLFGDKAFLDEKINDIFKDAGLLHLLAVSGLHVGFLVLILNFIFSKLRVKNIVSFLLTGIILLFYAMLCSFTPSVLRASIMCIVLLGAKLSGKPYDALNGLGLAGILLMLTSPLIMFDGGFLMSFFCVFAIVSLQRPLAKVLSKFLVKPIADSVAMSVSAQLGVLPFLGGFFGSLNLLTIFANLVLIPLFGFMFMMLFATVVLGLILNFFFYLLLLVNILVTVIIFLAGIFVGGNFFTLQVRPLTFLIEIVFFTGIFLCGHFVMVSKSVKIFLFSIIFAFVSALSLTYGYGVTKLAMLDYYGITYVITTRQGETLVIGDGLDEARRYLALEGVSGVDFVFLLKEEEPDPLVIESEGVRKVFTVWDIESAVTDRVYENIEYEVSNFSFKFLSAAGELVGVEVRIDGFFMFFGAESESIFAYSFNKRYNVVGNGENGAPYLFDSDIYISKYGGSGVNFSSQEHGNFSFNLNSPEFCKRLD